MPLLEISDLHVSYGAVQALRGVSLSVGQGEIVALIGANGAGKSTTLRAVSGIIRPHQGHIRFDSRDITHTQPDRIVAMGISHVPEGRRVFARLTVRENLELGAYTRRDRKELAETLEQVFARFPRLRERTGQLAGTLSGGEQQMLAMGRALMSRPRLMLLDEPSMGLAPMLVREIFSIISDLNAMGTTILLVEQNANMALSIAHRAYVLETGQIVLSGPARDLTGNPEVRRAYLGG